MKPKAFTSIDELPTYISLKDAVGVCNKTESELMHLAEQEEIEAYVVPPVSASVFRIFSHQKDLYYRQSLDRTRHIRTMLEAKDKPELCQEVQLLKLSKEDCGAVVRYGTFRQSFFEAALHVSCKSASRHPPIFEMYSFFGYILAAAEPDRIVLKNTISHSSLTPKSHKFSKENIRLKKSQIAAIAINAKPCFSEENESGSIDELVSDDDLVKTLHHSTSDRLKTIIKLCRELWFVFPFENARYPTRQEVKELLSRHFEYISKTELPKIISIITPSFSKQDYSNQPITDEVLFLSEKLKMIIRASNTFHKNKESRDWIYTELRRQKDKFSGSHASEAQLIIAPTTQLPRAQERAKAKAKAKSAQKNA